MRTRTTHTDRHSPTRYPGAVPILIATIAVAALAVPAFQPSPQAADAPPAADLRCREDACTATVTYVLDDPADHHRVTFEWATEPAKGFAGNAADVVRHTRAAGLGEPTEDGGYRYTVHDIVWHSDIRCDEFVAVTIADPDPAETRARTPKPVPADLDTAYCSDDGMRDERVTRGRAV